MNIKNRIRVITYNDDNHDIRVFVNGVYIGELSNPKIALELLKYGMCRGALDDKRYLYIWLKRRRRRMGWWSSINSWSSYRQRRRNVI